MFERYNINDLLLASINVIYPEKDMYEVNVGDILIMDSVGYGYLTILKQEGDKYIDLNNMSRKITTPKDPRSPIETSYIIEHLEPLSKYYTQEGKKKKTFSRKKAIREANKYYGEMNEKLHKIKKAMVKSL